MARHDSDRFAFGGIFEAAFLQYPLQILSHRVVALPARAPGKGRKPDTQTLKETQTIKDPQTKDRKRWRAWYIS